MATWSEKPRCHATAARPRATRGDQDSARTAHPAGLEQNKTSAHLYGWLCSNEPRQKTRSHMVLRCHHGTGQLLQPGTLGQWTSRHNPRIRPMARGTKLELRGSRGGSHAKSDNVVHSEEHPGTSYLLLRQQDSGVRSHRMVEATKGQSGPHTAKSATASTRSHGAGIHICPTHQGTRGTPVERTGRYTGQHSQRKEHRI